MPICKSLKVSFNELKHRKIEDSVTNNVLSTTELLKMWYDLINKDDQYELRLEKEEIYSLYRSQVGTRKSMETMNLDELVESRLKRRQMLRNQENNNNSNKLPDPEISEEPVITPPMKSVTPIQSRTVEISQELDQKMDEVIKQSELVDSKILHNSPKLESSILSPLKLDTETVGTPVIENFELTPREENTITDSKIDESPSKYEIAIQTSFKDPVVKIPEKREPESVISKIPMLKLPKGFVPKTRLPPMIPFGQRVTAPISEVKPIQRNFNRPEILNTQKFLSFGASKNMQNQKSSAFLNFAPSSTDIFNSPKQSIILEQQNFSQIPLLHSNNPSTLHSETSPPQPQPRKTISTNLKETTTKDQIKTKILNAPENSDLELAQNIPSEHEIIRLANTHSRSFLAITK